MFCSRQHIMTHSSRRYYFRQITNENYKEKRVQYGALRYARWNSTPCTIYSFYDNSLFSVGEIILTPIQSAPEIPKLHIFCSCILCATLSKAFAKFRRTTSTCLPSSKAFDHWWCDITNWVKSYYNLDIYLAFHHVCQDQYIYKVYQTKVILVLM